jgi:hypothetical protein
VATVLNPPTTGHWSLTTFPEAIVIAGRRFRRAQWQQPYDGVVAQYREDVEHCSRHLKVYADGFWAIDHIDETNPDKGDYQQPVKHFFDDHPLGALAIAGLVVGTALLAARLLR